MNWDEVTGNWKEFRGNVKEKWGKLADNDLGIVGGKFNQILDRIQVDVLSNQKKQRRNSRIKE